MSDDAKKAEKKSSPVRRVVLGVILLLVLAGGAWFFNDSQAADSINANISTVNGTTTMVNRYLLTGNSENMKVDDLKPRYDKLTTVVEEKGGGTGILPFLTRSEIKQRARDVYYTAASLRVLLATLMVDRERTQQALADFDTAVKDLDRTKPDAEKKMADAARMLLENVENWDEHRDQILAGMQAGAR